MLSFEQETNSQASFFSVFYSPKNLQKLSQDSREYYQTSQMDIKQSQKTIIKFDDQKLVNQINESYFQEQLSKYTGSERKFLLIDKNKWIIIDTREQKALQEFIKRSSTSSVLPMKIPNANNFISFDQAPLEVQRKKWQSNSINESSIWQQHWKESNKVHENFMAAICKNSFQQFSKFMDRRQNFTPIQINYRSQSNWCPIHYAAMHVSAPIMSRLINHSQIDVNALTDFQWTPLHIAVQSNKYDNCELLISAGVCIDYKDKQYNTALHYAAQFGYKSIIQLLITSGASQWIKNTKGLIPRQLCKSQDLLNLLQKPLEQQQPKLDMFYRLKRNAFVQKMITSHMNQPTMPCQSNLPVKQKDSQGHASPFLRVKALQEIQSQKKYKSKNTQHKGKTANQNRKNNIFKMYQLIIGSKSESITLSSFKFYKKIGQGAFGQVYVVKKADKSDKFYAMKAIKKERVIGTALYRYIHTQKQVLSHINHPFIVKLHFAFQTQAYLFLVMDYCEGGDMSRLLQKKQKLDQKLVRMYAAQILLGVQALHKNMIIYRDLKPDNIVLDKDGHACITDFGLSKKTTDLDAINKSFCGTPAYLPLQIINKKGHTRMADWYEFGIVLYQLMTGIPPFYAENKTELYEKVRQGVIRFPKNSSQTFRDLIKKLLAQNPQKRLGFENDAQSIKQHEWFKDIDWEQVYQRRQKVPPLQNKVKIPSQPIQTKFADIKSQKYFVPSWSFIN